MCPELDSEIEIIDYNELLELTVVCRTGTHNINTKPENCGQMVKVWIM